MYTSMHLPVLATMFMTYLTSKFPYKHCVPLGTSNFLVKFDIIVHNVQDKIHSYIAIIKAASDLVVSASCCRFR